MEFGDFVEKFRAIFEDGESLDLSPTTVFHELEEWDSLAILGFMSMIDMEYDVRITPADLKAARTLQDLFQLVESHRE